MKWPLNQIKLTSMPAHVATFMKSRRLPMIALASLLAIAVLIAGSIAGWMIKHKADIELDAARAMSAERAFALFKKDEPLAFTGGGVELIQSSRGARALAQFNGGDILLFKDGGELFRLSSDQRNSKGIQLSPVDWKRPESLSSCQLAAFAKGDKPMGETLWLMSGEGMWRLGWQDERLSGAPRVSRFGETPNQFSGALKSNVVFDDLGRLWAGSFRDGIDLIAPDGVRITHLEKVDSIER